MDPVALCIIFTTSLVLFIASIVYVRLNFGRCFSKADLSDKTVIITGANTGIGYYTALDMANRNARVILACRNLEKAEHAKKNIIEETDNDNVIVKELDLSSMKSVRKFANEIIKEEKRLDILINNAGVVGLPKIITEDGLESMFATNHFGPFLLTNLLLDLIKKSCPSRIVNVSSIASKMGRIELDNLRSEKYFNQRRIYFDSKLANILFTKELARRLKGHDVLVNCLHPGTIQTELLRNLSPFITYPLMFIGKFFFKNCEEGAQTTIYCAISEEIEDVTGKYFTDCYVDEQSLNKLAHDETLTTQLWDISEKYTGLSQ
ncbi:hypothetical protein LOTGIDRAFT_189035 [Lottia gigantea]|uniref:Retinol dehydrogenase 14 n=1 Tax=Lottia gigantea TaxID=225164 RepID=V4AKA2_LOTGI|nr:hypothetical protein LOTGIDRAFT_189035 [Lottia gigantea]ESO95165.1 hypothetical protein LOTGIDRAFT_189035 [Lottia gigantea]